MPGKWASEECGSTLRGTPGKNQASSRFRKLPITRDFLDTPPVEVQAPYRKSPLVTSIQS
jgi:hypothetical protein